MASRRKVPVQPEAEPVVKKRRSLASKPASKTSLDAMIAQLQQAGYSVEPASTSEDVAKQEASKVKLGLKRKADPEVPQGKLVLQLGFTHSINGQPYGPGIVELDASQVDLYQTLLHQEGYSRQYYLETTGNTPQRSFIIRDAPVRGAAQFQKVEVPLAALNDITRFAGSLGPTIAVDSAGYSPQYTSNPNSEF